MAVPTIVRDGNFFDVSAITEDVFAHQIFGDDNAHPEGKKVTRLEFVAGANDDIIVIKQGDENGSIITTLSSPDVEIVDRAYFYGGQYMRPFIDFDLCTLGGGHRLIVETGGR